MKPELISFDTNAWSNLMRRGTSRRRHALKRLRSEVQSGQLQVVMSNPLLKELAPLIRDDNRLWRDCLRELSKLSRGRLLRSSHARQDKELRQGRGLLANDVFYTSYGAKDTFEALASYQQRELDSELKALDRARSQSREVDEWARDGIRAHANPVEKKRWNRSFRGDPKPMVLEGFRRFIGDVQHPEQLSTCWARVSFHVAHAYVVTAEGDGPSKLDGNDLLDSEHYIDACYSTVLVTDDGRFHRVAALCAEPKTKVVRLDDWATAILSER